MSSLCFCVGIHKRAGILLINSYTFKQFVEDKLIYKPRLVFFVYFFFIDRAEFPPQITR